MRTLILTQGELPPPRGGYRALLRSADLIIATNGGARHALTLGMTPDVVVGDLDSLTLEEQEQLEAAGTRLIAFPAAKDETDLELALLYAVEEGTDEIVVLGAMGGRMDQTVANILLLALPELVGVDVRLVVGAQTGFLIRGEATFEGTPGDTVSLIPLGGDAEGVTTEGLKWPLQDEPLRFGPTRGVSNVLATGQARVRVRQGLLLCVVTHTTGQGNRETRR